jgi:hypothetical protein
MNSCTAFRPFTTTVSSTAVTRLSALLLLRR